MSEQESNTQSFIDLSSNDLSLNIPPVIEPQLSETQIVYLTKLLLFNETQLRYLTTLEIKYLEELSFTEEQITNLTQTEIEESLNDRNFRILCFYNNFIKDIEPYNNYYNNFISSINEKYSNFQNNENIKNILINNEILKNINIYAHTHLNNVMLNMDDDGTIDYVMNKITNGFRGITYLVL